MNNAVISPPEPTNEPVRPYAPGSSERAQLKEALEKLRAKDIEITPIINGKRVATGDTFTLRAPHDHAVELAIAHRAGTEEAERAIESALEARSEWSTMEWTDRAAIFLRAAELLSGPWRIVLNAATMLGQSKNVYQAEIDSACELIDFFRFNAAYAREIYADQPNSDADVWNRMQYRPLEGFVYAVPPFNFTSIAGNLPTAPALMGNVVLWKPAQGSLLASYFLYKLLEEAGLPPGVINFLPGRGPVISEPLLASPKFSGLHFTGSVETFEHLWQEIGTNISRYESYPRIVGETGGKDFVVAHSSAETNEVVTALTRGAFEYQGQKCSAVSRTYIPESLWPPVRSRLGDDLQDISIGGVEDFSNFVNAVIDEAAYEKITGYIDQAANDPEAEIIFGGGYSNDVGYFIEPTVIQAFASDYRTMREEIFGPVLTVYVYPDDAFRDILEVVDQTSPYGLTGAIFARNRAAVVKATDVLEHAAGNFYINDKPTGAVVGQQPFGGARKSGTNDKAGSKLNLLRWVSPRAIKETITPPSHYAYPFLREEPAQEAQESFSSITSPPDLHG